MDSEPFEICDVQFDHNYFPCIT